MASRNGRSTASTFVPTGEAFGRADMEFSLGFWVWSFAAAPEAVPQELIARAPAVIVNHMLDWWSEAPDAFPAEVCAVLCLWSEHGPVGSWHEPLEVWRAWADDVRGGPVASGYWAAYSASVTSRRALNSPPK